MRRSNGDDDDDDDDDDDFLDEAVRNWTLVENPPLRNSEPDNVGDHHEIVVTKPWAQVEPLCLARKMRHPDTRGIHLDAVPELRVRKAKCQGRKWLTPSNTSAGQSEKTGGAFFSQNLGSDRSTCQHQALQRKTRMHPKNAGHKTWLVVWLPSILFSHILGV